MKEITARANETKNGFTFPSEYSKALLLEWMKKYSKFKITPIDTETRKGRRYLEGAIIPEYCSFQYDIDPCELTKDEARRWLFKRDFNYNIIQDREGNPVRIPESSKGKANDLIQAWTQWATENGCKVPNPELYKLWRDKWKVDGRFPTFHEFLKFLKLDCDAMPSAETLKVLEVKKKPTAYPEYTGAPLI